MQKKVAGSIEHLSNLLSQLPGVGERTAQRFAYHICRLEGNKANELAEAICNVQKNVKQCSECCLMAESDPCPICSDTRRDTSRICVVEGSRDAYALESSGSYRGIYHVLGGRLAPLDGIEPKHLNLARLVKRVRKGDVTEIILATNPDMEGDTTASMVRDALEDIKNVSITRLARGLPSGSHLEYANSAMLSEAIEERREL